MTEWTTGPDAPESDVAAKLLADQQAAGVGTGETSVDAAALLQMIQDMQAQVNALQAEKSAGTVAPIIGIAKSIADLLVYHGDAKAQELAADLVEAAASALQSNDTGYVAKIGAQLEKYLRRNPPAPGENHYYRTAVDQVGTHLADAVDSFVPRAKVPALAGGKQTKVIAGNVTG